MSPKRLFVSLSFVVTLLLALGGCAKREHDAAAHPAAVAPAPAGQPDPAPRTRARTVTRSFEVVTDDVDRAARRIREEVVKTGGYVADASAHGGAGSRSASVHAKIPADKVQGVRPLLEQLGEVRSDVEKVEDVTEQRADLDARLSNARAQEKRLLEILAQRTGNLADVLAVEKELAQVRETIERLDAQSRTLAGQIELATVNVTVVERSVAARETPGRSIARAASTGVDVASTLGVWIAMAIAGTAPVLVPLALLVMAVSFVRRAIRRRRSLANAG